MSQRESSELNALVDWYIAVWHEPDAELRRKRIAELWVEDGCIGYLDHPSKNPEFSAV